MSKVTKKTAKKVIAKKGRPKSEFPRGYIPGSLMDDEFNSVMRTS